jgi:hypothetical protein
MQLSEDGSGEVGRRL